VCRYISPENDVTTFRDLLQSRLPGSKLSANTIERLYDRYAPEKFGIADLGYIARVHPLELWLVAYLQKHPEATLKEILDDGRSIRQEVYQWLFRTSQKAAQDRRIRILLEMEVFEKIHKAWQRVGYPFDELVPSYATAIGSSADRPAALAELMGIILNDGVRLPIYEVEKCRFAVGTPYEVHFARQPPAGERVLKPEIAQVVREFLFDVVKNGTARRLRNAFSRPDGTEVRVGGKTGTGDHRYEIYGRNGQLISSKVMNRAASFAFILDDRFFGNITAYVPGPEAADYRFTSSLPVAIFKLLAPTLMTLADREETEESQESPVDIDSNRLLVETATLQALNTAH
jgi:membrane peptidoglycan carboxypeptidase